MPPRRRTSARTAARSPFPPGPAAAGPEEPEAEPGLTVLRDCAETEDYIASMCFNTGPPRRVGVELEWVLSHATAPQDPLDTVTLVSALGPHTPHTLDPASPASPLPEGSGVTVEPGGQLELASPPVSDLAVLLGTVQSDTEALHGLLAAHGLRAQDRATDPLRSPVRVLDLPRYRAMEQSFDRHGTHGRSAMCSTAAVQVCLDAGAARDLPARWAAVHALGPVLLGAFANSPMLYGRRTGWKSSRWVTWARADPARTMPPPVADVPDPAAAWARRVLRSPVLCIRGTMPWTVPEDLSFADWIRGGLPTEPTLDDLRYHISTLFPPVRPRGYLEVRYIDAQPGARWALPAAVLVALLTDPAVTDRARAACAPAEGRWMSAARHGLADPVLARAATTVFELACAELPRLGAPQWLLEDAAAMTERQVARGLCPADLPDPT